MRRSTLMLIAILAVAFAARLLFCWAVVGFDAPLRGDEFDYHSIAANIVKGEGFAADSGIPTALRPPLFPMVLGGIYRVIGERYNAARLLQVLLGVLVVLLVYLLAGRLFERRVALLAAALAAFNPFLIFISAYLLTENLYMVLVLVSILLLDRVAAGAVTGAHVGAVGGGATAGAGPGDSTASAAAGPGRWRVPGERIDFWTALCAGVILGLASLTRPTAFPFALLLAALLVLSGSGGWRTRFRRAAVLTAAVLVVVAPWSIRNRILFGESVPFTTHGGITFYQGNNLVVYEERSYQGGVAPLEALPHKEMLVGGNEAERDREARRLGMAYLRDNPGHVPLLLWRKLLRTWRLGSEMGLSGIRSGWWWDRGKTLGRLASSFDAGFVYSIVALPLFLIGLVLTARRWRRLVPLYGLLAVHTAVVLVFFGSLRARIPLEPVIALLAAAALLRLIDAVRRRPSPA